MQCPRCQSERNNVIRTIRNRTLDGKKSAKCDLRIYRCGTLFEGTTTKDGCGREFFVECTIAGVEVFTPGNMKSKVVTLAEYLGKHLAIELQKAIFPMRD